MKNEIYKQNTLRHQPSSNEIEFRGVKQPALLKQFAFSKTTLFNLIHEGLMPDGILISERSIVYLQHELNAVFKARLAGQTPEQIKALVKSLKAKRLEGLL